MAVLFCYFVCYTDQKLQDVHYTHMLLFIFFTGNLIYSHLILKRTGTRLFLDDLTFTKQGKRRPGFPIIACLIFHFLFPVLLFVVNFVLLSFFVDRCLLFVH